MRHYLEFAPSLNEQLFEGCGEMAEWSNALVLKTSKGL